MEPNTEVQKPNSSKKRIGCWIAGCLTALVVVVLFVTGIIGVAFWATKGPIKVVYEQLAYLRSGNIEGAYGLTCGDFQKATSLEQFKEFVLSIPSLAQNKSASFTSREIEGVKGFVSGTLTAMDGSRTPVRYELVKENDMWKIRYIEISKKGIEPSAKEKSVSYAETAIERIEVGTQRVEDGSIKDPEVRFQQGIGDIKVAAYVSNAKKGQWIGAVWYFAGEKITDPVIDEIEEDGDFISQFYLSAPSNGWPTGNYKVVISIDKGKVTKEAVYSIGI